MKIPATQTATEALPDLIDLGSGDPDFNQPTNIINSVTKAMEEGYTHYCFAGDPDYRKAIAQYYKKYRGVEVDPIDHVNISAGGSQGIFQALGAIVNSGDEVIIFDPTYTGYRSPIQFLGGKIVRAAMRKDSKGYFQMNLDKLKDAISSKTKILIVCNPDNPTGHNFTERELEAISQLAIDHDFLILSDEIYDQFVWGDKEFFPIISLDGMWERTIVVMSLSKTFAWTGCRAGYTIANPELTKLIRRVPVGSQPVPTPFQKAAAEALNNTWDFVEEMRSEYRKRIEYCVKRLNEIPNVSCLPPEATFYLFPDISSTGLSSKKFETLLKEMKRVQVRSGTNYGEMGEGHVRIPLVHPMNILKEAMNRIDSFVNNII